MTLHVIDYARGGNTWLTILSYLMIRAQTRILHQITPYKIQKNKIKYVRPWHWTEVQVERRFNLYLLPPYHYTVGGLEKIANQTRDCQDRCRAQNTSTTTKSHLPRTWKRVFTQRNFYRAILRSRQVYTRNRSPWRISKTRKHFWPSWVKKVTSFMTMGSPNHFETRRTRYHRLQTVPTTTQRWQSTTQMAQRRRK